MLVFLESQTYYHQLVELVAVMAVRNHLLADITTLPLAVCALVAVVLGLVFRFVRGRSSPAVARNAPGAVEKHPWVLQFPPSRRHTLADLKLKGTTAPYVVPSPDVLRRRAVPSTRTADWDANDFYTPTGFSTQDIRALGRFPDYSVLTGVRYPKPYGPQFDISKAVFRPFRPFRWSYHQTMGEHAPLSRCFFSFFLLIDAADTLFQHITSLIQTGG